MKKDIVIFSHISSLEKLLFIKHLSIMIKAGIPIADALDSLIDQTKNVEFKKIIEKLLLDVQNGQSLAKSLKKFPKVFNHFFVSLIEVGETSGNLETNLEFLGQQIDKQITLNKKIKGALMYPGLIFSATLIMGTFISFFVLPQLVDFFAVFDTDLPLATKILLFIANSVKDYGLYVLIALLFMAALFLLFINQKNIKPFWHSLVLKIPIFGKLISFDQLANLSRNLSLLLKSGLPITDSISVTADSLTNLKFKNDLYKINIDINKGKQMSDILKDKTYKQFPITLTKMIQVGEKTGQLEQTLSYMGQFYEEEIDNISKNLSTILEPFLLVFIGLVVGFVAIAIISPIYQLTGSIR